MKVAIFFITLVVALNAPCTFAHPGSGIFVDQLGRIYFTDTGEGVWLQNPGKTLILLSKSALHWMAYSTDAHFAHGPRNFGHFERITPDGSKPVLIICSEFPCALGKDGNLYYADTRHGSRITRRTPEGRVSVLAGISSQAPFLRHVTGIAAGSDNFLYVTDVNQDNGDHAVLKIAMDGKVSIVSTGFLKAVQFTQTGRGDSCRGLAVDGGGNIFVAGTSRRCVVRISPQGITSVVLQAARPWSPTGVAIYRDELYVLEYSDMPSGWNPDDRKGWVPRVRKVAADGTASIVARVPREDSVLRR
jgi:sugar lactone lactonase YvrE